MKKIIPTAYLLVASFLSAAQDAKWSISVSPAIIQSTQLYVVIQPGVEYSFNDRFSLLTEFAFRTKNSNAGSSNNKYFRVKPELRYNLSESKRGLRAYVGFQASYTFRSWDDHGGCYYSGKMSQDSAIAFDRAKINSPILTWSFQFGTPFALGKRLDMDLFMGLGMRTIFTSYSDVQNPTKSPPIWRSCVRLPSPQSAYTFDETVNRFHSNFGVRFLYRF